MKTKLPLLACLLCISLLANAQSLFKKQYTTVTNFSGVDATNDGGYIMIGNDNSVTSPSNACLVKTDASGTVMWAKSYGDGVRTESGRKVMQTKDGGYFMVIADQYVMGVKTDAAGNVQWSKHYQALSSVNTSHTVNDMIELPDSSIVIAGSSANGYCLLFKIDKNGNIVWGNHQGNFNIVINKIIRLSSGEFMCTGSYNNAFYAARLNATGTTIWSRTWSIMGTTGKTMMQSSDGNFVYVGTTGSSNTTMMKTDINSNVYWAKSYSTSGTSNYPTALVETGAGDFIWATYSTSYGVVMMKVDFIGNGPISSYNSTGASNLCSNTMELTPDGGYAFVNGNNLYKVRAGISSATMMCQGVNPSFSVSGIAPTFTNVSPIYNTYMGTVTTNNFFTFAIPSTMTTLCGGKCTTGDNLSAGFNMADTVCQGSIVNLTSASTGASQYSWTDNGLLFSTSSSVNRTFNVPGTYKIKLTIFNGSCIDSASKYITVRGNCGTTGVTTNYFTKTYTNLSYNGVDNLMTKTADKGYVMPGGCSLLGTPDMLIMKTDSNGTVQWGRSYGNGSLNEYSNVVVQLTDGSYMVIGDDNYVMTVRVGPTGSFIWENNYQLVNNTTTPTSASVRCAIATADTGAIVVGNAPNGNGMLFKINGNGSVGWTSHKANTSFSQIIAVGADYWLIGSTGSTPIIMKVDAAGTIIWSKSYASMNLYVAHRAIRTSDGNYVVLCNYQSSDLALMKVDPMGDLIWANRLGGIGSINSPQIHLDKDGGFIITSYTSSYTHVIVKTTSLGVPVDQRYYTAAFPTPLVKTGDGAYVYLEGSSLRKFTAFNQIASCSPNTFGLVPALVPMAAPTTVTPTPNTYAQANNQFYIPNNTTHSLSTPCNTNQCNLSATFNAPLSACVGQTVSLVNTSIGGATYTWSENSNPFSNSFSTTRSFSAVGTYNISLQVNAPGCSGSMNINIVVSNQPTANAGSNATIACGATTGLTGSGGTTYTWSPITGLSNPYIANPTAGPSTTTAYTLTASNSGCTSTASVLISVSGTPTVTGAGGGAICFGKSANLSASGTASTYTWMPGGMTGSSVTVAPTVTTTYTVNGYAGGNCYGYDLVTVVVNPLPAVPTITQNGTFLQSSAATSYQWYLNGGLLSGAINQTYTFTQNGNYTVVITDVNGCTNTSAIFVVTTTGIDNPGAGIGNVSIYPNPTPGTFNVETNFGSGENVQITLSNMLGEVLQVIENGNVSGYYKKQVNTENLSTGIYLLTIKSGSSTTVKKVVKQD